MNGVINVVMRIEDETLKWAIPTLSGSYTKTHHPQNKTSAIIFVYHRSCSALLKASTPMLRCGVRAKSQNTFTLYALKGFQCRIFDLMKSVPNWVKQEQ